MMQTMRNLQSRMNYLLFLFLFLKHNITTRRSGNLLLVHIYLLAVDPEEDQSYHTR